uniref:Solute carrier family 22 member 13a n=1 Tax=Sphaeramia orbicularis TaxID=375764 RepID=A0A673B6T7_9TELE
MADFGEILRNIGEFGLFQRVTLVALCFTNFIQGFLLASVLFIEKNPDRHYEQLNLTLPREADETFSKCQMFVPVDWDIDAIREFGLNKTTSCQNGWVYKSTLYKATIVTDFDLVCDKANLLEIIQAISMVGILLGSLLFGPLWIGASKRSWGVCLTLLFTSVGQCALAGLVYYIRDWRLVQIIIAAPLGVVLLYIWCVLFIPESARWLLSRGRTEEAKQFSLNVSFYCLYLNMANLGLNVFLTQFIFGAIEIPAHILCIWLLEVFGRKPLFMLTLATAGVFICLFIYFPGCGIAVTSLAALSRFFLIWAVCVSLLLALFCTISSKTGAIVAPLLNITAVYHWIIPIVVSSGLTFISGGLGFLLHETRRKELPDSTDEAEGNRYIPQIF